MKSSAIKWFAIVLYLLGASGLFVIVGWINEKTRPITVTDTYGDSTILFEAEHGAVLLPNNCVTMQWQTDGIAAIYFDRTGVGGSDSRPACINSTTYQPSLKVSCQPKIGQQWI